jgi:hypothetical protein
MLIHPGAEPLTDAEKAVVGFLDSRGPGAWPHMLDGYADYSADSPIRERFPRHRH